MQRRTLLALSLMTILALSWYSTSANASSLNYAIHDGRVSVDLSLHFFQNATEIAELSEAFAGSSAQNLTFALQESLKKRTSDVSVSSLSGELVSAKSWINSTMRFEVAGASMRKGDFQVLNCSWIGFNVPQDLRFRNLSYNLIGATYVRPAFEKYVDYDKPPLNETISSVTYVSREGNVPPAFAVNMAGNATLLDFTSLDAPIQTWQRTFNLTTGLTTWIYNPGPAVDLTMTVTPRSGVPSVARAFYSYNATVSVAGLAQAEGYSVKSDVGGGVTLLLMFAAVVVSSVVAIVASWNYRSRRRLMARRHR